MKNTIVSSTLILLALVIISCSSDSTDDSSLDPADSVQVITDLAVSGSWIITSFIDSGTDETNDFAGFIFTFNTDGSLVAVNGSTTITGNWSVTSDDSSDDDDYNSSDDIDFNIMFSAPPEFAELSEDWDIVSRSNTRIELIHVSGGDGGTDTLTFEKN